jgi:hypothetical protein
MNIQPINSGGRGQDGMITVIFIALLAIMMIVTMVETKSLIRLHQEVKLLERQQIKRLSAAAAVPPQSANPATNAVSAAPNP